MATHALAARFPWDALERAVWSGIEFTTGLVIVAVTPLDTWWALPIGVGLAALKAFAAKRIGQRGTASTLPASMDPAATAFAPGGTLRQPPAL
jgi:hypothetical protein